MLTQWQIHLELTLMNYSRFQDDPIGTEEYCAVGVFENRTCRPLACKACKLDLPPAYSSL